MIERTEAIVMRSIPYGESDSILTLLSSSFGKLSLMARGAKRSRSKLFSSVQPLTLSDFVYYHRQQMGTINQAETIDTYRHLKSDIIASSAATYSCELMLKLLDEESWLHGCFPVMRYYLEQLDRGVDPLVMTASMELFILNSAGYAMKTESCSRCEEADTSIFDNASGGLICLSCATGIAFCHRQAVGIGARKLLRKLNKVPLIRIGQVRAQHDNIIEVRQLIAGYMDYHTQTQVKSRIILDQLVNQLLTTETLKPDE